MFAYSFYLRSEDEIAELSVCEEEHCEHHRESADVLRGTRQCRRQLVHSLVDPDVVEHLGRASASTKYK